MKTRILSLLLVLSLLMSAMIGCGRSPKSSNSEAETEPDYSWFSLPEETGRLTVYIAEDAYEAVLTPALELFRERYPEVEVNIETYNEDEYKTVLRKEIPEGMGPDLVLFQSNTFPDIYKTMSTGVFEDLNPYFALDEEIVMDDFVVPVMDGGVMNGKRYIVPLSYKMPLMLTTQGILDEIGMSAKEIKTCGGFIEAAKQFRNAHPNGFLYADYPTGYNPYFPNIRKLYLNFGFDFINYETDKAEIDEKLFRQCMDLVKLYYDPDYDVTDTSKSALGGGQALVVKECLIDDFCSSYSLMHLNASLFLLGRDEVPILFVQRNQYDGVTAEMGMAMAVPCASANKASAWNLLKILLSDQIQRGHDDMNPTVEYIWSGFPVRRASLKAYLDTGTSMTPEKEGMIYQYMEAVQSPTEAVMVPNVYRQYIEDEIMPYIRGEKEWNKCYKNLVKALKTYMKG